MSGNRERHFVSSEMPLRPRGGVKRTLFVETRVIQRLHVHHVHVLLEQLDDFIQLFVVAVAVHKDLELGVASLGLPGLYMHQVDVVFLEETLRVRGAGGVLWKVLMVDTEERTRVQIRQSCFNHNF